MATCPGLGFCALCRRTGTTQPHGAMSEEEAPSSTDIARQRGIEFLQILKRALLTMPKQPWVLIEPKKRESPVDLWSRSSEPIVFLESPRDADRLRVTYVFQKNRKS